MSDKSQYGNLIFNVFTKSLAVKLWIMLYGHLSGQFLNAKLQRKRIPYAFLNA